MPVFHQSAVRTAGRERLRLWLEARGIVAQALYPMPLHRQPAFAKWAPDDPGALAVCERCCAEVLSLPVHAALTEAEVRQVAAAVREWTKAGRP